MKPDNSSPETGRLRPGRRAFLAMAGGLAGAGLLAGSGRIVLDAAQVRTAPGAGYPAPAARLPASAPTLADWNALGRTLSAHRLIRPGQPGYGHARLLFDPRFDNVRPTAVAYCGIPADVIACLDFAQRFALPFAIRSGGHSYAGWSGTAGLLIDVSDMNAFTLDRAAGTVTVGAGLHLIDFYHRLAAHGLAVPAGSCPTVGLAGLTLGGGVGVVGRAYGLTCDNLEALEIVTADGSVLTADATGHSDLYWASRGGGGGNFGVATTFTFRTHELSQLVLFFLSWPWSQARRVIAAWQHWAPAAPDALWSNMHLAAAPGGPPPSLQVGGTYLGSIAEATHHLDALYAAVGSGPASTYLAESSYREAMLLEAGCSGMTVDQCQLPWQAPGGRLSREPAFAKSDFFTAPLSSAAITTLLRGVEALRGVGGASGGSGGVAFDSFGGALNRVPASATAFVHRDALFLAQYSTQWSPGAAGPGVARQHAWLREFYASMRPYASGQCYQNYIDPDLRDWRTAYYGANYARLAEVKAVYDPRQVFSFPQAITPGPHPGGQVALLSGSGRARPARSA